MIKRFFKRLFLHMRLHRILRAIKIKRLCHEQLAYILDDDRAILDGPRANGKTTAVLIKSLLYSRVPSSFMLAKKMMLSDCTCVDPSINDDPDISRHGYCVARITLNSLKEYALQCERAGIHVRRC